MRVDWVLLDDAAQREVQVGDLVSVEAGGAPTWRVLKLTDGRAWLRDEVRQMDCSRLRDVSQSQPMQSALPTRRTVLSALSMRPERRRT